MMSYMPETDSEDELPPCWEERATDDGTICYINHQTNTTQWVHPRTGRRKHITGELPIGWEKIFDQQHNRYVFRNQKTNQTTNIDPRIAFAVEQPPQNITKIRQRFDASSTALQVLHGVDLHGRLAIVTGSNVGIGFETARSLLFHGCEVIFACRNAKTTQAAIEQIANERPATRHRSRFIQLDLSSFKSVVAFIDAVKQSIKHIDYLILNAGVFGLPFTQTEDGLETTFQVSHLSHFHITLELESLMDHTSRVIVVSSESHRFANLPAEILTKSHLSPSKEQYWSMMAYNNAKLCNVLFSMELAKHWQYRGISVFSLHPGNLVFTQLSRNWWLYRLLFAIVRPFTKSLQQAAATTIYCATANELTGLTGLYFNNCFICEPSKLSQNEQLSKNLWSLSEKMIKEILENITKKDEDTSRDFIY